MSRIQVIAQSDSSILRLVAMNGEAHLEVTPNGVITIGNSIGGYVVAPVDESGKRWGFWRIPGGLRDRIEEAQRPLPAGVTVDGRKTVGDVAGLCRRVKEARPEGVVIARGKYLLADSSGSARNGVVHRFRPAKDALDGLLKLIAVPEKEVAWKDLATGDRCRVWESIWDGCASAAADAVKYRKPTNYVIDVVATENSDCMVQLTRWYQSPCRGVTVWQRPGTSRDTVADVLAKLIFESGRADGGIVRALEDLGVARKWVRTHYTLRPAKAGDSVTIDGVEVKVFSSRWQSDTWRGNGVIDEVPLDLQRLINHWGAEQLFRSYIGKAQRAFLDAGN